MLPAALLLLFISSVSALRICSRTHYNIDSDAIFQRVELPSAEKCVERCIENINYCRAVVYLESRKRSLGFCIVHTVNSETDKEAVHPDTRLDPKATIIELLERCPAHSSTEIQKKISGAHKRLLEEGREGFDDSNRSDDFFPEQDRLAASDSSHYGKKEHYAVMKSLDSAEDPRNPFDSPIERQKKPSASRQNSAEYVSSKNNFDGLVPIRPAQVTHLGQGQYSQSNNFILGQPIPIPSAPKPLSFGYIQPPCTQGIACFASHDTAPCPARQGDPCAPKPHCPEPRECYHVDAPMMQNPPEWSEWGPCSATCGPAMRSRTCPTGLGCIGPAMMPCNLPICQDWTAWSPWTPCASSCGTGERSRSRTCRGGRDCEGPSVMVESCQNAPCATWAPWGEWQGCTIACGRGRERRNRICINGLFCPGQAFEDRTCDRGPCPHWSDWTSWTECTSSCGGGDMTRKRECIDGSTCTGASEERVLCNQQPCPTWTPWTAWTVCEDKCGEEAFRLRNRVCLYRGQAYAGCDGPAQDQLPCPVRECASWTDWGDWSDCSATCGQGNQVRNRKCEGGMDCPGSPSELRFCQLAACPYWGEWGDWSGCSVSCGMGVCERRRKCVTDEILNLPTDLSEFDESTADFESDKAKEALIARSKHIKMMGNSSDIRMAPSRATITDAGSCDGPDMDRKTCDAGPCCSWDVWTEWSPCIGCGATAMIKRSRQCTEGGRGMPPLSFQEDSKYMTAGADLSGLSPIVPIIHRGIGKRQSGFQFDRGQCQCSGPSTETQPCPQPPSCEPPRPACEWSSWAEWCGCAPCRAGRENRRRFCDRGGRPDPDCRCPGTDIEERTCPMSESCFREKVPFAASIDSYVPIDSKIGNVQLGNRQYSTRESKKDSAFSSTPFPYPVCRWSKWSEWSECHETRLKERNRFCIGSDGLVSNCQCMGLSTQETDCDPSIKEREKPDNIVPGVEAETSSQLEFTSDGEDLEAGVDTALKSTEENFSVDERKMSEEFDEPSPVTAQDCSWTRWSMWSDCTVTCGQGERYRRRRCPCAENRCGGGIDSEREACQKATCLERRSHPDFSIGS